MGKAEKYNSGKVSSVIGKNTVIEGKVTGNELLRIDGLVKGEVFSEGRVIIGREGRVEGIARAKELYVGGLVKGEVFSDDKVEINATGKVLGDIHTKRLIVDDNAVFEGRCEMLTEEKTE